MMRSEKNLLVQGTAGRPMAVDVFAEEGKGRLPVIIYAHGFNGFKDWGNFDLVAERFAREGYAFVKFNFSHNGTTPGNPGEFTDLEAFGNNNYSKQLNDLRLIVDWLCDPANPFRDLMNTADLAVIGHSMGGGISILYAAADQRIQRLITWAAISKFTTPWGNWPAEKMQEWERTGIGYYLNSRTNQNMPLYYQLYQDYEQNKERLDICRAISSLQIPVLICHGKADSSVPFQEALGLRACQPRAGLFTVDSDHVFGRKHPWIEDHLPAAMEQVINASLDFLAGH
jgi:alpha-beta hydrolase superfamily lysophospholipase